MAIVTWGAWSKSGCGCKILHVRFARNHKETPLENPDYTPEQATLFPLVASDLTAGIVVQLNQAKTVTHTR